MFCRVVCRSHRCCQVDGMLNVSVNIVLISMVNVDDAEGSMHVIQMKERDG